MDFSQIVFYLLLAAALILAIRIFTLPIKFFFKLLWSTFVGFVLLIIFNALGGMIGLTIAVNAVTALTVGILGIPGLILLLLIKWLFFFL
ncbi:MAG: pro-sigmaK processing inhibitor BofA family protein [Clostridiaceae bacterium]|nr:pro-sigmaK processing inhibitor BofA family protein [Clostridiaceae bacterium]